MSLDDLYKEVILEHYKRPRNKRPLPGATVFGTHDPDQRGGAISFWFEDIHPHDLATVLGDQGVAVRAGHHCAQILMRRLGVPATARASFHVYSTPEDVDALIDGLEAARQVFG